MPHNIVKQARIAVSLFIILTMITGIFYPAVVTGIAQLFFPWQANGSILRQNEKNVASLLIGQSFSAPHYFWGRPSATLDFPYHATASSGSNFGPTNPDFLKIIASRTTLLRSVDPKKQPFIPVELVTASASGLDPDISPQAAFYQVPRIAKARNLTEDEVILLIHSTIHNSIFDYLGERRLNVVQLNLALDRLKAKRIN